MKSRAKEQKHGLRRTCDEQESNAATNGVRMQIVNDCPDCIGSPIARDCTKKSCRGNLEAKRRFFCGRGATVTPHSSRAGG
eukprot:5269050-Amphidinium_carterae.1